MFPTLSVTEPRLVPALFARLTDDDRRALAPYLHTQHCRRRRRGVPAGCADGGAAPAEFGSFRGRGLPGVHRQTYPSLLRRAGELGDT